MNFHAGLPPELPSAAFLDRDGTVIRDSGYLSDPEGVDLLPGAAEAIRRLNEAGVPVVMVTNQSGIGRGLYSETEFKTVQAEVERLLAGHGARIDAVYHCPHAPQAGCPCRKPALGMYEQAAADLGLDLSRALYVGNRRTDVEPALATGGSAVLVASSGGRYDAETLPGCGRAPDLLAAIQGIIDEQGSDPRARTEKG